MLLNQDQDLLADLSIAICSSCNLATSFGNQYAVCDQYADQYVSVVLADSRHTSARFHLPLALPHDVRASRVEYRSHVRPLHGLPRYSMLCLASIHTRTLTRCLTGVVQEFIQIMCHKFYPCYLVIQLLQIIWPHPRDPYQ